MATLRILTLQDARNLMLQGKAWTLRMEHTTQGHHKFWLATGRAIHEPVEVHFGAIGAKPTILVKDWNYVQRAAPEKQAKGYGYSPTPFVRVQPSTIALAATPPSAPQPAIQSAPPVAAAPVVIPPAPIPVVVGPVPPGPWGRIMQVQKLADGTWAGLTSAGDKVMGLTKNGARNLVRDYPHIQVAGL